jgi:hypothetical protein
MEPKRCRGETEKAEGGGSRGRRQKGNIHNASRLVGKEEELEMAITCCPQIFASGILEESFKKIEEGATGKFPVGERRRAMDMETMLSVFVQLFQILGISGDPWKDERPTEVEGGPEFFRALCQGLLGKFYYFLREVHAAKENAGKFLGLDFRSQSVF